jgi:hypothetical protein
MLSCHSAYHTITNINSRLYSPLFARIEVDTYIVAQTSNSYL